MNDTIATSIEVGFLAVGQSCFYADELFLVVRFSPSGNSVHLQSIRRSINLDAFTVVQDPKDEQGEPMTEDQKQNQISANINNITLKQINTTMNYANASAIINTKDFNTVADYVEVAQVNAPSLAWDTVKDWRSLCNILGIDFNTVAKGKARPAIDKVANELHGNTKVKTAVSTKVKMNNSVVPQSVTTAVDALTTPTVSTGAPAVQPAVVLPKSPKRSDYPKDEQGEDDFDAAMTEWIKLKQSIEAGQPADQAQVVAPVAPIVAPKKNKLPPLKASAAMPVDVVAKVEDVPAVVIKDAEPVAAPAIEPVVAKAAPAVDDEDSNIDETALQLAKLLSGIKPKGKAEVDPAKIQQMIQDAVADETHDLRDDIKTGLMDLATGLVELQKQINGNARTINVTVNNGPAVKIDGLTHYCFDDILTHASVRDNVLLVGPAGSGKTTVCKQVATALNLPFYATSVCAQTSDAKLFGYMNANGQYVGSIFRDAYENGGIFLLDEMDSGNANILTALNAALDNGFCPFPDKMVNKHEDFVCIAGANTYGAGANREYVGRNQLDAATLDRFSVIDFGYDENLEMAVAPNKEWAKCVQAIRKELATERVVISPRATIRGGHLIQAGKHASYALQTRALKGMAPALADRAKQVFAKHYNK